MPGRFTGTLRPREDGKRPTDRSARRATSAAHQGGFRLPQHSTDIRSAGVGSKTVRLADVPLEARLKALDEVIGTAKTRREATRLLRLVLEPGDAGGRIAA